MSTFEIVIITSALCGLVMIIGGILLLYKGIIRLNEVSAEDAVKVEFQKIIKISSRYPALGLFIIGLFFMIIAIWNIKPQAVEPIEITGKLPMNNPHSATINVSSANWSITPSSDGNINGTIYPNFNNLKVEIIMPGYDPPVISFQYSDKDIKNRKLELKELKINNNFIQKPPVQPGNIVVPTDTLPPLSAQGQF